MEPAPKIFNRTADSFLIDHSNRSELAPDRQYSGSVQQTEIGPPTDCFIHVSCIATSVENAVFTIVYTGLWPFSEDPKSLVNYFLSDYGSYQSFDDFAPPYSFAGFAQRLKRSIMHANICSKKHVVVEVHCGAARLRFRAFSPKGELKYCQKYELAEPGISIQLPLPTNRGLGDVLQSYFCALRLGSFYLQCPRIVGHLPALGVEEDLQAHQQRIVDIDRLNSALCTMYGEKPVLSVRQHTLDGYSIATAVAMVPAALATGKFTVEYIVVVNNTPLHEGRSTTCPTLLDNLRLFSQYNITLQRLRSQAEKNRIGYFNAHYEATLPHGEGYVKSCIIVCAIHCEANIQTSIAESFSLDPCSPCPDLSEALETCLEGAFSECVSFFASGIQSATEKKAQQQTMCAKYILSDLHYLSSILLTPQEQGTVMQNAEAEDLRDAINKTFTHLLK